MFGICFDTSQIEWRVIQRTTGEKQVHRSTRISFCNFALNLFGEKKYVFYNLKYLYLKTNDSVLNPPPQASYFPTLQEQTGRPPFFAAKTNSTISHKIFGRTKCSTEYSLLLLEHCIRSVSFQILGLCFRCAPVPAHAMVQRSADPCLKPCVQRNDPLDTQLNRIVADVTELLSIIVSVWSFVTQGIHPQRNYPGAQDYVLPGKHAKSGYLI